MPMNSLLEYRSNYSGTTISLWFYLKIKQLMLMLILSMSDNAFQSFKYKPELLGNKVADGANGILRNTTIAVPLKYLSNFWRSLEMLLINSKVELKQNWIHHCVLSAAGEDYDDVNSNNIIFTIKETSGFISRRQPKTVKTS